MKLPKTRFTYCPSCRTHTEHRVLESKRRTRGTAHPLSWGGRIRPERRGAARGHGNLGKYSKPAGGSMYNRKQSKKTDLRYECTGCKKQHNQRYGFRAKKIEFK